MADVLKAMPGTTEVQIRIVYDYVGAQAAVEYRFPDRYGRRRLNRFSISREPEDDDFYSFHIGAGEVAARNPNRLRAEWETQCRVREEEPILITASLSEP